MGTAAIDLSAGFQPSAGDVDLSAGLKAKDDKGFFHSFADASGLSALVHPIDAIMGIPGAVKQAGQNIADAYHAVQKEGINDDSRRAIGRAVPIVGPAVVGAQQQYDDGNKLGALGTMAGTGAAFLGPEALKAAKAAAPAVVADATASTAQTMQKVGAAAQDAGSKLVNETVGSYKADFKRGANPGRGYLSTGNGVSLTMRSLASKAQASLTDVGQNIQRVIDASGKGGALFPVNDVLEALSKPLKEAHDAETQAGGMGNTAPFEQYAQQFKQTIADGLKKGGFTAQDVFDLKKQIAKKSKFNNTTPEGIMDVRQSQVGALGGLLKSAIPDLAPLNQAYQDLVKLADRAQWRAESGSVPLRTLITEGAKGATAVTAGAMGGAHEGIGAYAALSALDSTAGRTAIASTLYNGGKAVARTGANLSDWLKGTK